MLCLLLLLLLVYSLPPSADSVSCCFCVAVALFFRASIREIAKFHGKKCENREIVLPAVKKFFQPPKRTNVLRRSGFRGGFPRLPKTLKKSPKRGRGCASSRAFPATHLKNPKIKGARVPIFPIFSRSREKHIKLGALGCRFYDFAGNREIDPSQTRDLSIWR